VLLGLYSGDLYLGGLYSGGLILGGGGLYSEGGLYSGGGAYSRGFTVFALRAGEITVFEPKVVIFTARIINTSI
jgi:hypothetical protein